MARRGGQLVPQSLPCHPWLRRANVGRREVAVIGAEAGGLADHEEGELRLSSHSRKLSLRATMPCCIGWAGVGQVRPGLTQRLLDLFCHPRRVIGSGCHHLNPILFSFRKFSPWKPSRRDSLRVAFGEITFRFSQDLLLSVPKEGLDKRRIILDLSTPF